MKIDYRIIIVLVFILLLKAALFMPFLQEPLERGEGAYGYVAQRVLAGEVPYRDAFDHKPPLIYFVYAGLIKLFGNSIQAIRIPTLFYSLLTTGALFYLGFLFLGAGGGLVSAFLYAIFSGGPLIQGTSSNTETFMVLPLVLALIFFVKGKREEGKGKGWWFLGAGLFSGMAIMFKQVALFNFLILLLFLFSFENKALKFDLKHAVWFMVGSVIVPFFFVFYFLYQGAWSDFIYGVFIVNQKYLRSVPGDLFGRVAHGFMVTSTIARLENSLLWAFGLGGLLYIFIKDRSRENLLLAFWALASFVGVAASGLFFGHYFIQLIPALCLLSAYALKKIKQRVGIFMGLLMVFFSFLLILSVLPYQYPFYSKYSPAQISIHKYRGKSFAVSHRLAGKFRKFLKEDDKILVWSANPELYFYLNKKAPTRYFNYLRWMEEEGIKEEIIDSILKEKPDYIVWTGYAMPYKRLKDLIRNDYAFFMQGANWRVFKKIR